MPIWNEMNAQHLLSRSMFGYRRGDLDVALSYSLEEFVDNVLLKPFIETPEPPGDWVNENPIPNNATVDGQRRTELRQWWIGKMLDNSPPCVREKMVLFWHNHFVSEMSKVNYPQRMYHQNVLFRSYAFGNFKDLTKAVTTDPAMLIYLDGNNSSRTSPNENYGRELLELFTLGIGNYTENDVKEAARALTGWQVNGLRSVFNSGRFDNTPKTVLGLRSNFNHNTLIDHIFTQEQTAQFLCRKLYKEFVYAVPDENFVSQMAEVFRNNNYEIKPVLSFLFQSEHFYSYEFIGTKIKSPLDIIIGAMKQLNIADIDKAYIFDTGKSLQQELFEPPDVRGWEGQRKWISSATFPLRNNYTDSLISGRKSNGQTLRSKASALTLARSYGASEDAPQFNEDVIRYMIQFPQISTERKEFLLETLMSGTVNWSTYLPMAESRIQNYLRTIMRLPEYQLC